MALEIDERLKKILTQPGVVGYVVINHEGLPMKTSLTDEALAVQYAALSTRFVAKLKQAMRSIDFTNELKCTRIRSKKEEIMVMVEKEFILIVIQKPTY